MGYVELDYSKIEDEVMTSLDVDKDGKVDTNDLQELWNRTMKASFRLCVVIVVFQDNILGHDFRGKRIEVVFSEYRRQFKRLRLD